jgi:Cd2+/Zn2+-exporting ATPase
VLTIITPFFYSLYASSFVYIFDDWFYRALIFLVISCPCALVISVPLSYFGGIGEASRNGILFKGGNFMDAILKIKTVVFDKTGTLTKGVFEVTHIQTVSMPQENLLGLVASIEKSSNHPIAKAIVSYAEKKKLSSDSILRTNVKDIPGYGLSAEVDGDTFYVGTLRLLDKELISYPDELKNIPETIVACAKNNEYIGYLLLSDTLKDDAREAVTMLRGQDIKNIEILSGDKQALVTKVADELDVNAGYGDLLPEGKVRHIEELKKQYERGVAFVGDGINDAPVIALSDIGVAMGALGSDMAVETADLVIQTDHPSKVALAISIAKRTHRIVIQNVTMALGVKAIVLLLGVLGVATLWEAVFADVGVTILAIFNTMRLIRRK